MMGGFFDSLAKIAEDAEENSRAVRDSMPKTTPAWALRVRDVGAVILAVAALVLLVSLF